MKEFKEKYPGPLRAVAVLAGVAVLTCTAVPARGADAPSEETVQLYKTKCQACHLADGNSPVKEMNFADGEWIHGSKFAEVVKAIEEGVPGKAMLPFKEQLTKEQIEALAKFVRAFDKKLAAQKGAKGGK